MRRPYEGRPFLLVTGPASGKMMNERSYVKFGDAKQAALRLLTGEIRPNAMRRGGDVIAVHQAELAIKALEALPANGIAFDMRIDDQGTTLRVAVIWRTGGK